MPKTTDIQELVEQFVEKLSSLIEEDTVARAREVVLSAFGGGRGPTGIQVRGGGLAGGRKRRKGPIQLCPVPGCTNRAAPVFGMVCSKHRDLPKAEIKKYREQRRAQKVKGKKAA